MEYMVLVFALLGLIVLVRVEKLIKTLKEKVFLWLSTKKNNCIASAASAYNTAPVQTG